MTKEIIIDGNNFSTLSEFYDEVENKLTKGLNWKIGRNLDAFNDVLRGGFGVHDDDEPLIVRWVNADKSKKDLGQSKKKKMLFDIIVDIIRGHGHIELKIE
jgi:RNAse (barnase) inhibitor barstar